MTFKETLLQLFKTDARLLDAEGELMGNKIQDLADKTDEKLIELLLDNPATRANFFIKIKEVYVFKTSDFKFYIDENKIDNSYTQYENRIGLTSKGKFLKDSNDVVLDFPYKDCILEGGQSTEEGTDTYFEWDEKNQHYTEKQAKRKEIFFNSVLAKDEIDRLLEPKAFANAKRYTSNGIEFPSGGVPEGRGGFLNRDENGTIKDNLIIKGNNLLGLHTLKKEFAGKVKLIYIDPPYNTGNDSFAYNDNFSHSSWLTFMRNRLLIARDLLNDKGIIYVQMDSSRNAGIGSSELGYLNILLDEIFGRKNFIGHLHWKKKKQPSFLSRIAGIMESILIYAKDETQISNFSIDNISDSNKPVVNAGNPENTYNLAKGIRVKKNVGKIDKGVYKTRSMSIEYLEDVFVANGRTLNSVNVTAQFRTSASNIMSFIEKDLLFITSNFGLRRDVTDEEKGKEKAITDLLLDWGQNQDADLEIKTLFQVSRNDIFSNPKPELLLQNLILCYSDEDDIVLDYHLGSGTTAAVAHKMNRQYIGIEQMNYLETVAVERLKKVISGEQGGISKSVNWQGGGSFIYLELAKNNQNAIDQIQNCNSYDELALFFDSMCQKYFLHYNVKIKQFKDEISKEENFKKLSLEKQKELFIKMLDLNQLYVNVADMEDKKHNLTANDIAITNDFYQI